MIRQQCDGDKQMQKLKQNRTKSAEWKTDPELKGEQSKGCPQESYQISRET